MKPVIIGLFIASLILIQSAQAENQPPTATPAPTPVTKEKPATIQNATPAEKPGTNEITISLFGQPCLLSGPFDKNTLKNIHSISPEQTYPDAETAPSTDALRKSIEKLKSASGIPPAFDRYKERLIKRFEAQIKFADALAAARKAGKSDAFLSPLKIMIAGKSREKDLEAMAKKIDTAKTAGADLALQLLDIYNEMIEPDPEDDFHRTVQKLGIRYTCDFSDESSDEAESE